MRTRFAARRRRAVSWLLVGTLWLPLAAPLLSGGCGESLFTPALIDSFLENVDPFGADPGPLTFQPRDFVNFETPHVTPLALRSDGGLLLAVNTPAARLDVLRVDGDALHTVASIPVGLDPVSVRLRSDDEAWVVNHISDSVSIVDLKLGAVVRTLLVGDEPTDVAFAAGRAWVICSQLDAIDVFDLASLDAPPQRLPLQGQDPRAAAVSSDGAALYVAFFESGNATTVVPHRLVSRPEGPYDGVNPPPNGAGDFVPSLQPTQAAPAAGLIVQKDETGCWRDENGADWSDAISWDVLDHDVAVIDTGSLDVRYFGGALSTCAQLAVRPDGVVTLVGLSADNVRRFEPNLKGRFVRSQMGAFDASGGGLQSVTELNPHLAAAYAANVSTLPASERSASLADPRGVAWSASGVGYVSGQGSDNVIVIDAAAARLGVIAVGAGPTGLALADAARRLYVLNRFDNAVSIVDVDAMTEIGRAPLLDPTPPAIRDGRPLLYNAHLTSGLGVTACAACHLDGRMDQLAWDLGNPADAVQPFDQFCDELTGGDSPGVACNDFHPLKGPMTTQSLQGITGTEPLHWRGDRANLAAFNPAFAGLNGNDRVLTEQELAAFEAFVATISYPPNPHRDLDNALRSDVAGGDAVRGLELYLSQPIDTVHGRLDSGLLAVELGPVLTCNRCHQLPSGTSRAVITGQDLDEPQAFKVPQLRNMHEKNDFSRRSSQNTRGVGIGHDGAFGTLDEFFDQRVFDFGEGEDGARNLRDVIAFVLSLSTDVHAGVGAQVTLRGGDGPDMLARLERLRAIAAQGQVGLIVTGVFDGAPRGFALLGGDLFQSDRAAEQTTGAALAAAAGPQAPQTWTLTPLGSQTRLGIDADLDGVLNGDEQP